MDKKSLVSYIVTGAICLCAGFGAGFLVKGALGGSEAPSSPPAQTTQTAKPSQASQTTEKQSLEVSDKSCKAIVDSILGSGLEFPNYMYVEDETMLTDIMGYDPTLTDELCSVIQMISADLFEITVIKPAEGQSTAVSEMLEKRREYLRNSAAFYPAQVEAADACTLGSTGGYSYLICAKNAADAEKKLIEAVVRANGN